MTFKAISIIGFGEAGPVFAKGFRDNGAEAARVFDIAYSDETAASFRTRGDWAGATVEKTRKAAVQGSELIISTVTADQTEEAAKEVAPFVRPGQIYLDLNSSSPRQKKAAAEHIQKNGGVFIEGVAMDTIPLKGFQVPLLLAGPEAADLEPRLRAHGMEAEAVGDQYGSACFIKLIRSVIIKGIEALFAEAVAAGSRLDVQDRVISTLYETFPGLEWRQVAGYHLSRLAIHGKRRAAEMRESALTIADLGLDPIMARAVAERQEWGVTLGLKETFATEKAEPSVGDFVDALKKVGA